ncbi:hypothetical protein [Cellulomonas sp. NPDC089187]|uniref:hypothetical protein n=1 Tax=Cellulomonas sp. NPDC089187 TaxID=3154970 RepID=UPI00342B76A3
MGQPAGSVPVGCLLLGWALGGSPLWGLLTVTALAVLPVASVLALRAFGVVDTLRITGRTRLILLAGGAAWELIAVALLWSWGAQAPLRAGLIGVLAALVAMLALHPTGVSAHTSIPALFAGALLPGAPVWGALMVVAAAVAGWARLRVGAHTLAQVAAWPPVVGAAGLVGAVLAG